MDRGAGEDVYRYEDEKKMSFYTNSKGEAELYGHLSSSNK